MPDILDMVKGHKAQEFQPGEVLIHEGLMPGKLFVLKDGQVEVVRRDSQVTHVDEPGSVFGEMSILLDQPYSATVKALSVVSAYVVEDAGTFLEEHPEAALHIATLLARRLYYTTAYLVDLQQQMAGRRQDLDVVDRILGSLFQQPGAVGDTPKPAGSGRKGKKTPA